MGNVALFGGVSMVAICRCWCSCSCVAPLEDGIGMVPFLLLAVVKLVTCPRHRSKMEERKRRRETGYIHVVAVQGFSISPIHFKYGFGRVGAQWLHKQRAGCVAGGRGVADWGARGAGVQRVGKWRCTNNNYHWQLRAPKMPTNETAAQRERMSCMSVCREVCCVCGCVSCVWFLCMR